jgi:hypothetical protein
MMLNEVLERMIKAAGFKVFGDKIVAADDSNSGLATESVKRLVEIVRADEREAIKQLIVSLRNDHCEATGGECNSGSDGWTCDFVTAWDDAIAEIDKRSNDLELTGAALLQRPSSLEG